jgi:hypothetical protein
MLGYLAKIVIWANGPYGKMFIGRRFLFPQDWVGMTHGEWK